MSYRSLFLKIERKVELMKSHTDKFHIILCPRCRLPVRGIAFPNHIMSKYCRDNCRDISPPENYEIEFKNIGEMDILAYRELAQKI